MRTASHWLGAGVLAGTLYLGLALPAAAAPLFRVDALSTHLSRAVYYLNATLSLTLNQRAQEAIAHGVPLTFVVDIEVERHRSFWWDKTVAELAERYRLSFRPLTEHYRVENLNSGAMDEYATLAEALLAISRIRNLPLVDASVLDRGAQYYVQLRAVLDTKDLPGPLKLLAAIFPGWRQASDWKSAVLKP